ncbi:MAG: acyl-CoA carboxylase subunit beta [Alphaproteobacteria bacterium]
MPIIETKIDPRSETFTANRAAMLALIDEVKGLENKIREHSARARPKFEKRGQLLPRERLALLLDRDKPFVPICSLAGYRMHDDDGEDSISGGGQIAGVGTVAGVACAILASDSGIKGGALSPMGVNKILRLQTIALENKLPMVNLIESAGANLFRQAELFVLGGRTFRNQARLSAAGIPQVTVVHGSSTAGGAYLPGLSDYTIAVRDRAKIFLAGPPLLKAALGEDATDEELGGAVLHATVTGLAEHLAEDDAHAIAIARDIVAKLGWNQGRPTPATSEWPQPLYPVEEILGIVPNDYRKPYDVREVIARLVDGSDFLEFKALYDTQTVCGNAAIEGQACAFIANNGPITPQGSVKAAQFIQACCQSGTPIIYLHNTTGYMVGKEAEAGGAIKHGAKMIQAVANASVPQITLHIGASFGAGNYGMCGREYEPRFIFAWPNYRIAVMGGEQAAGVMKTVEIAKYKRRGETPPMPAIEKMHQSIVDAIEEESKALYATARLWDDGIVDPRDSRRLLGYLLGLCRDAGQRQLRPSSFGVARM